MATTPAPAVRPSAVAGTWYPSDAAALRQMVENYLAAASPAQLPGDVLALVAPHAGYPYSGPTAAHAYVQVRGRSYARVVLMGPLHRPIPGSHIGPLMMPAETAYVTPLGELAVDHEFLAALGRQLPLTTVRRDQEHSLEIQLPFLQVALAHEFALVPIMMGAYIGDPGVSEHLGRLAHVLSELIREAAGRGEATLLLASTDLSHMNNYDDVVRTDRVLVDLLAAYDVPGLSVALREGRVMACGATGLVAALATAHELGATGAAVLAYAASGDLTGDRRPGMYTVGYVAAAVYA